MKQKDYSLVVLAAGMGSRFGKESLKQLETFGEIGHTLLEYAIYDAISADFTEVVFVIRRELEDIFEKQIISKIRNKIICRVAFQEIPSEYANFRTKPLGTAHALFSARKQITHDFMLINADDFYGRNTYIQASHILSSGLLEKEISLIAYNLSHTIPKSGRVNRGICSINKNNILETIVELYGLFQQENEIMCKDARVYDKNSWCSMNCWLFNHKVLELLELSMMDFFSQLGSSKTLEFCIPNVVNEYIKNKGFIVQTHYTQEYWVGITNREDINLVVDFLQNKIEKNIYPKKLW